MVYVVFHVNHTRFVIDFDGGQFAGNGFGNVYRRLVFAGGAQTEFFWQIAPAFGRVVSGIAPMGVIAVCGGGESGTYQQQDSGQAG